MEKVNFISNELKTKIINGQILTKEELELFFNYVTYKAKMITTYKPKLDDNISKELTALFSEICFSHNLDTIKKNINNHYFCIVTINNNDYLCDMTEPKYSHVLLNKEVYNNYLKYIKEKYDE